VFHAITASVSGVSDDDRGSDRRRLDGGVRVLRRNARNHVDPDIKAALLLAGAAFMVLERFGFSLNALVSQAILAHPKHLAIMSPGGLVSDPVSAVSLGLAWIVGPTVWVQVLGHAHAIYPYEYPALFSMIVAFAGIFFFSVTDRSTQAVRERALYGNQLVDCELGMMKQG
jgi:Na+(H+)/acetate symporter ActP